MYRSGYDDNGRGKRSHDDRDGGSYYGNNTRDRDDRDDRGGYKRSRHERSGGGSYYRPNNSNNNSNGYNNDRRGYERPNTFHESEAARSWRLTKKALVQLGEGAALEALAGPALRAQLLDAAADVGKQVESDAEVTLSHAAAKIVQCAGRLGQKTALYAVLVGLVHEKEAALGRKVLEVAMATLQKDVDFLHADREDDGGEKEKEEEEDGFRKAHDVANVALRIRLLVRLLGELVIARVVRAYDVLGVLDTLQSVCTPEDFNAEPEVPLRHRESLAAFKDFFASVVLDTLIHAGQELSAGSEDVYESLLSRCKEYVASREEESNPRATESEHATNWLTRRLRLDLVWEPESDEDMQAVCKRCDLLSLQWEALNAMRSEEGGMTDATGTRPNSKLPGVVRPHKLFDDHFQSSSELLPIASSISIDSSHLDYSKVPHYDIVFRILGEDSGSVGAPLMNLQLASYLIARSQMSDIVQAFYPKPVDAAAQVLAVTRGYNARFAEAGITNLQAQYLFLESLLVQALNEVDPAKHSYYCAVLVHAIKADTRLTSSAFAIVVELIFREIPLMSAGAIDSFVKLFSHFLSNFEFKWLWERWSDVLEAPEDDPQRLFVSTVLERCVRLSYLQHMRSVLPSDFHVLLPPEPKPRVVYEVQDTEEGDVSPAAKAFFDAVSAKLKERPSALSLHQWVVQELETNGISKDTAIDIVFTAILNAGAATFTHAHVVLDKYGSLNGFFSGEASELLLVKTVGFVWVKSPQHIGLILNMMLRQKTIRAATVAKWIFTSDAIQQYSWPYVWGILDDTIGFMQNLLDAKLKQRRQSSAAAGDGNDAVMTDVDALDDEIKRLQDELRQFIVIVFEGFNRVIMEHKSNCDADGIAYKDNWFASALAQMKALGGKYRAIMEGVLEELHLSVFKSSAADHDAKQVFDFVWDSFRSDRRALNM